MKITKKDLSTIKTVIDYYCSRNHVDAKKLISVKGNLDNDLSVKDIMFIREMIFSNINYVKNYDYGIEKEKADILRDEILGGLYDCLGEVLHLLAENGSWPPDEMSILTNHAGVGTCKHVFTDWNELGYLEYYNVVWACAKHKVMKKGCNMKAECEFCNSYKLNPDFSDNLSENLPEIIDDLILKNS